MVTKNEGLLMLTSEGWVEYDEAGVYEGDYRCMCGGRECCDPAAPVGTLAREATEIIDMGTRNKHALCAVSQECRGTIYCENATAQAQSEYEMDYYSGYE